MTGRTKVIKVYESFIMGKCRCGCEIDIPIRNTYGFIKRFAQGHHIKGKYARLREKNPMYKGGLVTDSRGYWMILRPDHPNAESDGYIYVHRLVMSNYLGRPLVKGEEIHHKDGNIKNNKISNLQLLSKSEHSSITNTYRERKLKDRSDDFCIECGSSETKEQNGRPHWLFHPITKEPYVCNRCYMKIWHRINKK